MRIRLPRQLRRRGGTLQPAKYAPLLQSPAAAEAAPEPEPVPLMRFLTVGGAAVELWPHRFVTRYTHQGRPMVHSDRSTRECDGYRWSCAGCGATGKSHGTDGIQFNGGLYLDVERDLARRDANTHATECRSMPAPAAG
ncbi:hypothetical protein [Kitasatospora sp. A2-31]|uniref:hypothetical protein n=1 Tax=Kitasatospora sp. A2-31 TaxID=2916414 RepID=UPI001EEBE2D9|nr:hypothetical protein [Kitasatospora sp. A2-31]MCG6496643.1 hypothetical protein [Kitasatospora sp. A2-31]